MVRIRSRYSLLGVLVTCAIFLAVLALSFQPVAAAPKVYKLKVQTFQRPTDNWVNLKMVEFMKRVEYRSKGRLKLLPLLDVGTVCGTLEIFDAVGTGLLDVALTAPVYYMGKVPTGAVIFGMPYTWKGIHESHEVVFKRGLLDVVRKDFARHNVRFATYICSTEMVWFTKKRPIRVAEDFKGLKLRVSGAGQYAPRKLGASIVKVSYPELYTALQQGVIDGVLTIIDGLTTLNFDEVVDYVMMPPAFIDTICVLMNQDTWNKLPADLQEIWEDESIRFSYVNFNQAQYEGVRSIEKAAGMGVKVVQMSPELLKQLEKISVEEGWEWLGSKSPLSRQAVDIVKSYFKELGRIK